MLYDTCSKYDQHTQAWGTMLPAYRYHEVHGLEELTIAVTERLALGVAPLSLDRSQRFPVIATSIGDESCTLAKENSGVCNYASKGRSGGKYVWVLHR